MSKKETGEKQKIQPTKHGLAKKVSTVIVAAAIVVLGYKLWENP